jgi:hypothetical protein
MEEEQYTQIIHFKMFALYICMLWLTSVSAKDRPGAFHASVASTLCAS